MSKKGNQNGATYKKDIVSNLKKGDKIELISGIHIVENVEYDKHVPYHSVINYTNGKKTFVLTAETIEILID